MLVNELIASRLLTTSANSLALDLGDRTGYSAQATFTTYERDLLTFPAKIGATGGDYVVVSDGNGLSWAVALNVSGADAAPTGAAYVAVAAARKVNLDISATTTAATVAAAVKTAFNALTGFTDVITIDNSAADGTMLLLNLVAGNVTNPAVHNADDSGAGSITGVQTTASIIGSLKLQASNDGTNFADIASTTQAVSITASAAFYWSLADQQYRYVRAVWTYTSGTGAIVVNSLIKELDPK